MAPEYPALQTPIRFARHVGATIVGILAGIVRIGTWLYALAMTIVGRNDVDSRRLPANVSYWPSAKEPSADWIAQPQLSNIRLDGYGVLRDAGALRSRPCHVANIELGNCSHVGAVITVAPTRALARAAAKQELRREKTRCSLRGNRRWLCSIRGVIEGYDLRGCLDLAEAEYVRREIINGDGETELAWALAKTPRCQGLLIPTEPPTLFVFEQHFGNGVRLGKPVRPAVLCPSERPDNALDFVAYFLLGFCQPPTDP